MLGVLALLAAAASAIPSPPSSIHQYPRAEHSVQLYADHLSARGYPTCEITVGSQTVRAMLDTGSSSTWFLPENVPCIDASSHTAMNEEYCLTPHPRLSLDDSFEPLDTGSILEYVSGQNGTTRQGYDRIVFGGIEVPKQEIEVVTQMSTGFPDLASNVSGIIGLGYPSLTVSLPEDAVLHPEECEQFQGSLPCTIQHYSPLMTTIFNESLLTPMFALAVSRAAPHAGVLTIGGVSDLSQPSINVTRRAAQAVVPIEE